LLIPIHGSSASTALTLEAARPPRRKYGATLVSGTGAIRIFAMPDGRAAWNRRHAKWDADRVVLAARQLVVDDRRSMDADHVPVTPIRGQLIQLESEPARSQRVIWGPDGYLVPWPDGSVLVGSTVEDRRLR
jgi:glycine/D-amino acid oxidase-like deaminating enzyme